MGIEVPEGHHGAVGVPGDLAMDREALEGVLRGLQAIVNPQKLATRGDAHVRPGAGAEKVFS